MGKDNRYLWYMAKRGSAISVPESWLEQCRNWRESKGMSMAEVGTQLARAIRRGRAFGSSTIHRYLSGQLVTDELTEAFAKVMGVPNPIQIVESAKLQRWYALGARLDEVDEETFDWELGRLERLVNMAVELWQHKRDD